MQIQPKSSLKIKRIVYLAAASIFGLLINYFVLFFAQVLVLQKLLHSEKNIIWYSGYPPTLVFLISFLIFGIVWGFFAGRYWWRIIYTEKRFGKLPK